MKHIIDNEIEFIRIPIEVFKAMEFKIKTLENKLSTLENETKKAKKPENNVFIRNPHMKVIN